MTHSAGQDLVLVTHSLGSKSSVAQVVTTLLVQQVVACICCRIKSCTFGACPLWVLWKVST